MAENRKRKTNNNTKQASEAKPAEKKKKKEPQPQPEQAPRTKRAAKKQAKAEAAPVAKQSGRRRNAAQAEQGAAKLQTPARRANSKRRPAQKLRVIPIGGLHEIGKNMTVLEYGNDMILIDCGMAFPSDEMLGIDAVIPDFSYVIENAKKLRGLIVTHAHEDHIGGVPYLLKALRVPVYASRLTCGFIRHKLQESNIKTDVLNEIKPGSILKLGCFKIEALHTTHSVADSLAFCIETPVGKVFHTGDFKVDLTPVDSETIDFARLAEIGRDGLLLLLADSTNSGRKGYTPSEKVVGVSLGNIFRGITGRIIIATFSSNVHRVQKIIDIAAEIGRKVAISGRSMENMIAIATELEYLKIPPNTLVDVKKIKNIPDSELVIITTGSQGEPMSALARMAADEHRAVRIRPGDTIILSSTPVPGNEKSVSNVVNALLAKGARVVYNDIAETHVSGHACQEELKLIHTLLKPKFFVPVHGEVRHLRSHAAIAEELGMDPSHILLAENGSVIEFTSNRAKISGQTVPADAIFVDGFGVGDVGSAVINERRYLSENGIIIVAACFDAATGELLSGPEIMTRGLVYVKENADLLETARSLVQDAIESASRKGMDLAGIKSYCRDKLRNFIYETVGRSPVIIPIFLEN